MQVASAPRLHSPLAYHDSKIERRPKQLQKSAPTKAAAVGIAVQRSAIELGWGGFKVAEQLLARGFCIEDVYDLCGVDKKLLKKLCSSLGRDASERTGRRPKSLAWIVESHFTQLWATLFVQKIETIRISDAASRYKGEHILSAIQSVELLAGSLPQAKIRNLLPVLNAMGTGAHFIRECPSHKVRYLVLKEAERAPGGRTRGEQCPLCAIIHGKVRGARPAVIEARTLDAAPAAQSRSKLDAGTLADLLS